MVVPITGKVNMQVRIEKYFNLARLATVDLNCEDLCIEELSKTIEYLSDVSKLKNEVDKRTTKAKRQWETFVAIKSDLVRRNFKTKGITYSEKMVEDTVIHMNSDEYNKLRGEYDDSKADHELVSNLLHILYTRRDLIKEMINHFRYKHEKKECLMLNTRFLKSIEHMMENMK